MGNVQIWEKCCKHVNMASRRGLYETPDWVKVRQCHVDSCFFLAIGSKILEVRMTECWQKNSKMQAMISEYQPKDSQQGRCTYTCLQCTSIRFPLASALFNPELVLCPTRFERPTPGDWEGNEAEINHHKPNRKAKTYDSDRNEYWSLPNSTADSEVWKSEVEWWWRASVFFSGQVVCDGNCSSGLMLSSVKAALQQSFQLLLDGFLLGLNHGLGADPEKGRAAASRASKILRRLRAELWEKMTSKLTELDVLMQGIHPEVAQVKSKISLTTIQVAETTKATVKDKLKEFTLAFPSEHQIFLPNPPSETSLQEQFLVLAWFVTVMFVSLRLLTAMTKLAIKLCVSFPRRVLRITCRCCFRCLCPCERKGTQRV